jgi:hypothetical protein
MVLLGSCRRITIEGFCVAAVPRSISYGERKCDTREHKARGLLSMPSGHRASIKPRSYPSHLFLSPSHEILLPQLTNGTIRIFSSHHYIKLVLPQLTNPTPRTFFSQQHIKPIFLRSTTMSEMAASKIIVLITGLSYLETNSNPSSCNLY